MDTNDQKTLRDEFAMAALTGLLSSHQVMTDMNRVLSKHSDPEKMMPLAFAALAYRFADASLEARKK